MPHRSSIGAGKVIFAMNDSAGYECDRNSVFPPLPNYDLAGAAWIMSPNWTKVLWMQELWPIEVLKATHST